MARIGSDRFFSRDVFLIAPEGFPEMWTRPAELPQNSGDGLSVSLNQLREVDRMRSSIRNAQAAAGIEKAELVSISGKLANQLCGAFYGDGKGRDISDLRTNMKAHACNF